MRVLRRRYRAEDVFVQPLRELTVELGGHSLAELLGDHPALAPEHGVPRRRLRGQLLLHVGGLSLVGHEVKGAPAMDEVVLLGLYALMNTLAVVGRNQRKGGQLSGLWDCTNLAGPGAWR